MSNAIGLHLYTASGEVGFSTEQWNISIVGVYTLYVGSGIIPLPAWTSNTDLYVRPISYISPNDVFQRSYGTFTFTINNTLGNPFISYTITSPAVFEVYIR
jgi:hypothetical protein